MTAAHTPKRLFALLVVMAMAGVAATGFYSIRKDLENLQAISRDNILWSATQMEVELLRFQRSLALYAGDPTVEMLDDVQERFDILWSRFALFGEGRVGRLLQHYDEGHDTLATISAYLHEIDNIVIDLGPDDADQILSILHRMDDLQAEMRLYSLRVVRGDTAAAFQVRERIRTSSQLTAFIALAALLVCMITLFLIMRDNARQREMAALSRDQAEAAERATRAKSQFLTMMSHELRNPLNGIIGPLALMGQTEIGERQARLVERAQQSARIMLRMLRGLLDYGDIQDNRLLLREEAFRPRVLADEVRSAMKDFCPDRGAGIEVTVSEDMPDMVWGDLDRLTQVFAYIGEYVLTPEATGSIRVSFSHDGDNLIGDIAFDDSEERQGWKRDLLMGLSGEGRRPFQSEALGPLIARSLLGVAQGLLTLAEDESGRRVIRIVVPARRVAFDKIRVHLETRSAALATLYRAALRSDRVEFLDPSGPLAADLVLVDSTSIAETSLMRSLRMRFPGALFVSLGHPAAPGFFDEVVETPNDMALLRRSVLGRLAS